MSKLRIFLLLLFATLTIGVSLYFKKSTQQPGYALLANTSASDSLDLNADTILYEEETPDLMPEIVGFSKNSFYPQNYFKLPVTYDPFLSGTFGELRSNHFHAGLDIRTGGMEGKAILASASGYISRINVSTSGYGKAIYITHPNGYTTVYAHLQKFNNQIEWYVKKHQYQKESFTIELYPDKGLLDVNQGEVIAYSGNTGGSGGPHLHFEIRKSNTQEPVNPLLFGLPVTDNLAPEIQSFILYSIDKDFRKKTGWYPRVVYPFKKSERTSNQTIKIHVPPGKYSAGALLSDYFRSKSENLGVNYSWLWVNNQLIYECAIEKLRFDNQRKMNTHMDFCIHKEDNKKPQKLFIDDGNTLNLYNAQNKGIFTVTDSTLVKLKIMDLSGRADSIFVQLIASGDIKKTNELKQDKSDCSECSPVQNCVVKNEFVTLNIAKDKLYHHFDVCISKGIRKPNTVSSQWNIGDYRVPLHGYVTLSIKAEEVLPAKLHSKILMVEWFKDKAYPVGGTYNNGYVTASVRDFGTYYLAVDSIPPEIKVLQFDPNIGFRFQLKDKLSDVNYYRATIDGKWMLMEYEPKTGILFGKPENKLERGKHLFKLIVKDERGNETIFERKIEIP
jgi:hypothetical protein